MAPTDHITKRADALPTGPGQPDHGGALDPNAIPMQAVQALISIIGVAMVLGSIWFFFWAKNGGCVFRRGDWDDYKSTVLRRKGPNGTTLSNATKSTALGGGSVVGDGYSDRDTMTMITGSDEGEREKYYRDRERDETSTIYTGTGTELSSSTAPINQKRDRDSNRPRRNREEMSEMSAEERRARRQRRAEIRRVHPSTHQSEHTNAREETAKERKQREMRNAPFENGHDNDVRRYMKEKPARVGGINAASDTLHYGTDYTETEGSVYTASQVSAPRVPQHGGGKAKKYRRGQGDDLED